MHGIVLSNFKDFVVEAHGQDTWQAIQREADAGGLYVAVSEYPDEEVFALVEAAATVIETPPGTLLESFGRYLVEPLLSTYGVHVDGDWTALELVCNVEEYIHEALRAKQLSSFTPPELRARRVDDERVLVRYGSDRELCDLARGLLAGVGDYYGRPLHVRERRCMHDGAQACELVVDAPG